MRAPFILCPFTTQLNLFPILCRNIKKTQNIWRFQINTLSLHHHKIEILRLTIRHAPPPVKDGGIFFALCYTTIS